MPTASTKQMAPEAGPPILGAKQGFQIRQIGWTVLMPPVMFWVIFYFRGHHAFRLALAVGVVYTAVRVAMLVEQEVLLRRGTLDSRRFSNRYVLAMLGDMAITFPLIYVFRLTEFLPLVHLEVMIHFLLNALLFRSAVVRVATYVFPFLGYPLVILLGAPVGPYLMGHGLVFIAVTWLNQFGLSLSTLQMRANHHHLVKRMVIHNVRNQLGGLGLVEWYLGKNDPRQAVKAVQSATDRICRELDLFGEDARLVNLHEVVHRIAKPHGKIDIQIPRDAQAHVDPYFLSFVVSNLCENAAEAYKRRRSAKAEISIWYDGALHVKDFAGGLRSAPVLGKSEKKEARDGTHGQALYLIIHTAHEYRMAVHYHVDRDLGSTEFVIKLPKSP